jgi:hypothetical protein
MQFYWLLKEVVYKVTTGLSGINKLDSGLF